ncbi:hypothetical protein OF83DRAFT_1048653 [Amylostereum chailletii]|nr:hypothetical protein OF83DRAFT_1048653 [Amylostereum chailletii]
MWNSCTASFPSLAELVGHVNLEHLRVDVIHPPSAPIPLPIETESLSCQWGNCHDYPSTNSIPGSSSSTSLHAALGVLAEHLMHDHLGIQASPTSPLAEASHIHSIQHMPSPPQSLEGIASDGFPAEGLDPCFCRWQDCGLAFGSVDDLTTHITTAHVGGGKAHYDCFWTECTRNGEKGFSSKQKICRHIQSHTGHRPFQCQVCKQNFSEAATLQQHMRRHTQEKPYSCDFPGCGKAFAIAGALTIHKRTHNGQKPFKCTYCDRAFSESSNLSKHLRTHTGVRPYSCSEPGCGKAFSRPDQLARHTTVHKKGLSS